MACNHITEEQHVLYTSTYIHLHYILVNLHQIHHRTDIFFE